MALPQTITSTSPQDSDNPTAGASQIRGIKGYLVDVFGVPDAQAVTAAAFSISTAGVITVSQSPFRAPTLLSGTVSQVLRIESPYSNLSLGINGASIMAINVTGMIMQTPFIEWPSGVTGVLDTKGAQGIYVGATVAFYQQIIAGRNRVAVFTPTGLLDTTKLSVGSVGQVPISNASLVLWSDTPAYNYVFNGDMEIWGAGTSAAPTGWTAAGAGVAVARNTTAGQFNVNAASAQITPGGGAAGQILQDVDLIDGQDPAAWWDSKVVTFGCWVRATAASQARIAIDDGTTTTNSAYHSGGSSFEFLRVTATIGASPSRVRVLCEVAAGGSAAQFDGAVLVTGGSVRDFIPSGWRGRKSVIILNTDGSGPAPSTMVYYYPRGQGTTEVGIPAPYKGVFRNLRVQSATAVGAGETYTYVLRKAAANTDIRANMSGGAATTASDTTNEVSFTAGQNFGLQVGTTGGADQEIQIATLEYEEIP